MSEPPRQEQWTTRLGVIAAVAGSAVGLGNFLRFPGKAAEYGGGAFMIAYFCALIFLGLPIGWVEWTLARMGGLRGFHSAPGVLQAITGQRRWRYFGIIGVIIPVIIFMYYVYIEAWCLGYAFNFFAGKMNFADTAASGTFFTQFTGIKENGSAWQFDLQHAGGYLIVCLILNFWLTYRGIARGIEKFCNIAMPALLIMAIVVLVRVLTLGTPDLAHPERSVMTGLGFMWNPQWELLKNPNVWLEAAGQIFFSLSVGFGIVINYASYLRRKDDLVLNNLSAASANEFAEVVLGGLITLPAAVAFLGIAAVAGQGTFGLGFNVLPMVFATMPGGQWIGGLFFFLLFLAAITSSISMVQPALAFVEEALDLTRRASTALLASIMLVGVIFVVHFSQDLKALDTLDFWGGTFLIFIFACAQVYLFTRVIGLEKGWAAVHEGASLRIPLIFKFILRWITPAYLLIIFVLWLAVNVFGYRFGGGEVKIPSYITDLSFDEKGNSVAKWSVALIVLLGLGFALLARSSKRLNHTTTASSDS
jgi:neurotransmitter:Na+ symporter, NSS family